VATYILSLWNRRLCAHIAATDTSNQSPRQGCTPRTSRARRQHSPLRFSVAAIGTSSPRFHWNPNSGNTRLQSKTDRRDRPAKHHEGGIHYAAQQPATLRYCLSQGHFETWARQFEPPVTSTAASLTLSMKIIRCRKRSFPHEPLICQVAAFQGDIQISGTPHPTLC